MLGTRETDRRDMHAYNVYTCLYFQKEATDG